MQAEPVKFSPTFWQTVLTGHGVCDHGLTGMAARRLLFQRGALHAKPGNELGFLGCMGNRLVVAAGSVWPPASRPVRRGLEIHLASGFGARANRGCGERLVHLARAQGATIFGFRRSSASARDVGPDRAGTEREWPLLAGTSEMGPGCPCGGPGGPGEAAGGKSRSRGSDVCRHGSIYPATGPARAASGRTRWGCRPECFGAGATELPAGSGWFARSDPGVRGGRGSLYPFCGVVKGNSGSELLDPRTRSHPEVCGTSCCSGCCADDPPWTGAAGQP